MSGTSKKHCNPLAITIGDPAGIGPDIILSSWHRGQREPLHPFLVLGCPETLERRASVLGMNIPVSVIDKPSDVEQLFSRSLPVFPLEMENPEVSGKPDASSASMTIEAIDRAVRWTLSGDTAAVVTAPINKELLAQKGFSHSGHTEYLAHLCQKKNGAIPRPVMMLAAPTIRVVPVTVHIPLSEVPAKLSQDLIIETVEITENSLRTQFRISRPRIGITGLNPHAGESGLLGRDEIETVIPAIKTLKKKGLDVHGPLPADAAFQKRNRAQYDVIVAMYHDQALIPVKTIAFDEAVNVTLGLPIVRTSPDHGTAYDLAGSGKASPESFLAAIKMASDLSGQNQLEIK